MPDRVHTQLLKDRRELADIWQRELVEHIARYVQRFGPVPPGSYSPFAVALADLLLWIRSDNRGEADNAAGWSAWNEVVDAARVACGEIREHFPLKPGVNMAQHREAFTGDALGVVQDAIVELLTERCQQQGLDCDAEEIRRLAAYKALSMSDAELIAITSD